MRTKNKSVLKVKPIYKIRYGAYTCKLGNDSELNEKSMLSLKLQLQFQRSKTNQSNIGHSAFCYQHSFQHGVDTQIVPLQPVQGVLYDNFRTNILLKEMVSYFPQIFFFKMTLSNTVINKVLKK